MRVAVVVSSYSRFIESNPAFVARGLAKLNHDVDLITTRSHTAREIPYPSANQKDHDCLPFSIVYVPSFGIVKDNIICAPTRELLRMDYDVALLQEDFTPISELTWAICYLRDIPYLISSERYYYPQDYLGRVVLRLLDKSIHRRMWRSAKALTFHTRASRAFLESIGAPPSLSVTIPSGFDAQYFSERSQSYREQRTMPGNDQGSGKRRLLTVARLHPFKGLETLLRAVSILVTRGTQIEIDIIGRGPDEVRLRGVVTLLHLDQHVHIRTEAIPNNRMPAEYSKADLYIQPSLFEPFGTSTAEAMACGLPVIASEVGGLRDIVDDGITGSLVPPGDPRILADAIGQLLADDAVMSEFARNGKRRALELFDYRVLARQYENLLLT